MRRWHVERNPNGDGYWLVDENGAPQTGPDGKPVSYGSARAAQDTADQDHAWQDAGGTREDGDAAAAAAATNAAAADAAQRRADAEDPAARQAALDAGRPMSGGYNDPYGSVSSGRASSGDESMAGTPWGWFLGADQRVGDARRQREADMARADWESLSDYMPSANDLAVEYGQETFIEAPENQLSGAQADPESIAAQRRALEQLEDIYGSGGMTVADRSRLGQGEREMARAMRSQREADMSALRARGLGGSGAQVQSMLSAQQSGADMLADREADIQSRAESRAMDALAGAGQLASGMRGASWEEDTTRRGAMDDWNRWNTDARRESGRFNIGQRDRTGESRSGARQQAYENRERQVAGKQGVWQASQGGSQAAQQRSDERNAAIVQGTGSLLEDLLS